MRDVLGVTVRLLARLRVTLLYCAAVGLVAEALLHLGPQVQQRVIRHASTNLHNLGDGHLGTLIGSAFVNDAGPVYLWLPGLVALLALGELLWQSRRLVVAFIVGHIGATLIVAAGLAAGIGAGMLSESVADAADVGMSYGAVGVLGTFTAAIPGRWRGAWAGWWLALAMGSTALSGWDFTNAGHAVALILGMIVGGRFARHAGWTWPRLVLLVVGAGFGYLLMAYNQLFEPRTAILGAGGAAIGWLLADVVGRRRASQRNSSALASIQSDSHNSGGQSSSSPGISHS